MPRTAEIRRSTVAGLGSLICFLACLGPLLGVAPGAAGAAEPVMPDYLGAIRTVEDFVAVSAPSQLGGEIDRFTKYIVPATDDASLLPPVFQNVVKYPLHYDFLRDVFPDRFAGLDMPQYLALVEERATRRYFAGVLSRFVIAKETFYGFSIFTKDPEISPDELLSAGEVLGVFEDLSAVCSLRPLYYAPDTRPALEAAAKWQEPGFPVYLGGVTQSSFQAYTRATGYGRVRLLDAKEFEEVNSRGRLTWQDIVVLERAPSDIEGVVAGVITAEPQLELSHVAIRTARRGTPNAYVRDALLVFAPLEGKLIRLEVTLTEYQATEASTTDAEKWWAEHRPHLSRDPVLDTDYGGLDRLEEMDLSGAGVPPEARYGGKASNLARLQRLLTGSREKYQETGFAIPVRYYFEFLRRNRIESAVHPKQHVTYEQYLKELLASERFQSDAEVRYELLARFRDAVEDDAVVDPELTSRLLQRIVEVFGSPETPVRFRSSSNVEDALEFNGAGLYESSSACVADEVDGDAAGPSQCDPAQPEEKLVRAALKEVWGSLWTFRANEERSYYGIDPEKVGMGILVTRTFLDERANGVAFTGNPANSRDRRYLVVAQKGEESVVSPEPGKVAEKDLLEIADGAVKTIERAQRSSLVPAGEYVLPEDNLRELGALLWHIDGNFPVDLEGHGREEVLFDVEFKLEATGNLAVKQVRPFLVSEPPPVGPTFELIVPPGTVACGTFVDDRDPQTAYALKSQIRLTEGTHLLPTGAPVFAAAFVEEVLFGPKAEKASPRSPGQVRWSMSSSGDGQVTYSFTYQEGFTIPGEGGEELAIEMPLEFAIRPGEPPVLATNLDEEFLLKRHAVTAVPGGNRDHLVSYSSCAYGTLPLWQVRVELEGGDRLEFEERFQPIGAGSGPAGLVGSVVTIGGARQEVRDYWRLVYAAQRHNVKVRYWVVLEPPLPLAGGGSSVRRVEVELPDERAQGETAVVRYFGEGLDIVAQPKVLCYERAPAGGLRGCRFRRGDADSSGIVNLTDAVFIVLHLFWGGRAPGCMDAADFDDDGVVQLTDAIDILAFLFKGADLSTPPGPFSCGIDPTPSDPFKGCLDPSCR